MENTLNIAELKLMLTSTQINALYKSLSAAKAATLASMHTLKNDADTNGTELLKKLFADLDDPDAVNEAFDDMPEDFKQAIAGATMLSYKAIHEKCEAEIKLFNDILTQLDVQLRKYNIEVPSFDFDDAMLKCAKRERGM